MNKYYEYIKVFAYSNPNKMRSFYKTRVFLIIQYTIKAFKHDINQKKINYI